MGRRWRTASGKVHFLVGITRKWDVGHFCLTHAGCSAHTELWLLIMPILPLIYNCSAHLLVRSFSAVPLFPCVFQSAGVPGMFAHLPWGMFICPPSLGDVCLPTFPAGCLPAVGPSPGLAGMLEPLLFQADTFSFRGSQGPLQEQLSSASSA